jgi:hypothetical protein
MVSELEEAHVVAARWREELAVPGGVAGFHGSAPPAAGPDDFGTTKM